MKRSFRPHVAFLGLIVLPFLAHGSDMPASTAAPAPVPPSQDAQLISQEQFLERTRTQPAQTVALDVRTPEEFAIGHVPGALNLPHDWIASRVAAIEELRDRDVIVYCRSGRRSRLALDALRAHGLARLWHLEGDYLAWEAAGRPVERSPAPEPSPAPDSMP